MDHHFEDFLPSEETGFESNPVSGMEPMDSQYHPVPQKKQKKNRIWLAALLCTLLGSIAGSVITFGIYTGLSAKEDALRQDAEISYALESRREVSELQLIPVDGSSLLTPAQVYASNVNSTVGITTAVTTNFWGYQTTSAASGSGFVITTDGYILTNHHVIEDSDNISVSMYDGTVYDAALIGYDESNDIAVLKVEADNLVPVVLGDSEKLNVGDSVVAIGNPLGELTFSLTAGTVSAKDRKVTLSSTVTMDLIQTDCAINSGNSGGALFNLYGEVVGITNAKYSSSSASSASIDNIGFAIPINDIMEIVKSIIEKGYVVKPYMGVTVSDVSAETQLYGIPKGAAIQSVTESGPAAKSGLLAGDIITAVNGTEISGSSDLVDIVGSSRPGDILTLTVYRQGQTAELTCTIEEQIQAALENRQEQLLQPNRGNTIPAFPFGNR